MNKEISVVIPVYGSVDSLNELTSRLISAFESKNLSYEIILVDDGGGNYSWNKIQELVKHKKHLIGIKLSRNFGQHYAVTAGIDRISGNWCTVMDCDLQDQPEEVLKFYEKAQEGYQIVLGLRVQRQDKFFVKMTSKLFYFVLSYLTKQNIDHRVSNFGIYSRKVIETIKRYKEKDRAFNILISLVGFSKTYIEIKHSSRDSGTSNYNFKKRLSLGLDYVLSYSTKPLVLFVQLGAFVSIFSSLVGLLLIIEFFFTSSPVSGWTSIIVSLFFLFGILISIVGVVGLYIGKIYNEVKNRPLYIVDEETKS